MDVYINRLQTGLVWGYSRQKILGWFKKGG